nr:MAG: hypothetical protein DIU78_10575 [Pseudomonadota bacterium]
MQDTAARAVALRRGNRRGCRAGEPFDAGGFASSAQFPPSSRRRSWGTYGWRLVVGDETRVGSSRRAVDVARIRRNAWRARADTERERNPWRVCGAPRGARSERYRFQ